MGQDLGNTNGNGYGDSMNIIKKEIRKCDLLAARYYKLAEGDRERAARDWYDQVTKVTKMIEAVKFGDSKKVNKRGVSCNL